MGAWSHESFGNDDACDWTAELEVAEDTAPIEEALDAVLDVGDDYLDSYEATRAIAAAETIARLQGNFGVRDGYSEPVDEWVVRVGITPSPDLARKAHLAIDRILREPSELPDLWADSDYAAEWQAAIADLRSRIRL